MKIRKLTLIVAMLVMVLGIGGYALAQVEEEPVAPEESAVEQPVAQEPTAAAADPAAAPQEPTVAPEPAVVPDAVASEPVVPEPILDEASCEAIFRDEQAGLAATGVYPTPASEDARACEDLGYVNYFPVPYFYDTEGFMYTYDPVADRYTSNTDPATGFYYIYDLVTDRFYTYDPVGGTYL